MSISYESAEALNVLLMMVIITKKFTHILEVFNVEKNILEGLKMFTVKENTGE